MTTEKLQPVRFLETNSREKERVCESERLLRARALRWNSLSQCTVPWFFSRRYWTRCTSISQGFTWCGPTTSWSFPTPRSGVTFSRRRNSSRWPPIRTRRWVSAILLPGFSSWQEGGKGGSVRERNSSVWLDSLARDSRSNCGLLSFGREVSLEWE